MHFTKNAACFLLFLFLFFIIACNNENKKEKDIAITPESMDAAVQENITAYFNSDNNENMLMTDSFKPVFLEVLKYYYKQNEYSPLWSHAEKWNPQADEFFVYLERAAEDGLYKEDYHFATIDSLKKILNSDSVKRMDARLWTSAEILYSDAFMHIIQDLKQGRLQHDSLAWRNNAEKYPVFFAAVLNRFKKGEPLDSLTRSLQPSLSGYWSLKNAVKGFMDSMDNKKYTYVSFPYKATIKKDSIDFVYKIKLRLSESGISSKTNNTDSLQLSLMIRKFQQQNNIKEDGKISTSLIRLMNSTDVEKFNRIAITLDRYKELPEKMPERYILVNLPAFILELWDTDTIALTSKIICGKPITSTPLITSEISDLVIYPTWTVPTSIIKKELLPGLKRSSNYLAKKGLKLLDNKGNQVDPSLINWSRYSSGIPYKVQQGSGDDNALGVIKFNFENPYSVYLHDTNQRYLFKNSFRALSHGCVRVQEWKKMAFHIIRNDSLQVAIKGDTLKYNTDSVINWIAKKERHRIEVKYKIPLFIRYFGCEGIKGAIKFYDDIYGEDKKIKEAYFSNK